MEQIQVTESKISIDNAEIYHLASCINTHTWNGDKTQVAICPNNNEIRIYKMKDAEFTIEHVLAQHEGPVTSIDWAPNSNQLLSCSQDRNVHVWNYIKRTWQRKWFSRNGNMFARSTVHCKWSPKEDKFVATNGDKRSYVCYYDSVDFSLTKAIQQRHASTVLDAAWHPNNSILATVGSDGKCKIVSGFVKGIDNKESINTTSFGDRLPFGTLVNEFESRGWIQCVKWSPSGTHLVFASHDSSLTVVDVRTQPHIAQTLRYNHLPLLDLLWINDRSIVGVGYDCSPLLFQAHDDQWTFVTSLDEHFQSIEIETVNIIHDSTDVHQTHVLRTKHQNCITCIQAMTSTNEGITSFSTSGLDGYLILWNISALETTLDIKF